MNVNEQSSKARWNFALNKTLSLVRKNPVLKEWKGFSNEKVEFLQALLESNNQLEQKDRNEDVITFANLFPENFTRSQVYKLLRGDVSFMLECFSVCMDDIHPYNTVKVQSIFDFLHHQQKEQDQDDDVTESFRWRQIFPSLLQKAIEMTSAELVALLLNEAHDKSPQKVKIGKNDSSLVSACEQNEFDIVKLFVDKGYRLTSRSNLNRKSKRDHTEDGWKSYVEIPTFYDNKMSHLEEEDDDVYDLQILRTMTKSSYILACYLNCAEKSNHMNYEDQTCECFVEKSTSFKKPFRFKGAAADMMRFEVSNENFHYCPFNERFVSQLGCTRHMECNDPIFRCFDLAQKASNNAFEIPEYKSEYLEIADEARNLSVQLLDQCKNSREVRTLLAESSGSEKYLRLNKYVKYPRLTVAIEYNHKEFVGHIFCQQILRKEWQGRTRWNDRNFVSKLLYFLIQTLLSPLHYLVFVSVIFGRDVKYITGKVPSVSSARNKMQEILFRYINFANNVVINLDIPVNRFLTHSGHYCVFLCLIFTVAFKPLHADLDNDDNEMNKYPWYLYLLSVYCLAMMGQDIIAFANVKSIKSYFTFWRGFDILMHSYFLLYLGMRYAMVAAYPCYDYPGTMYIICNEDIIESRRIFDQVTNYVFAMCSTLAVLRLVYWMQLHDKMGPVIINFSRILTTFFALSSLINIVIAGFAIGFVFLLTEDVYKSMEDIYTNYTTAFPLVYNETWSYYSYTYHELYLKLFWTLLNPGLETDLAAEPGAKGDVIQFMFGLYQIIAVIVLLNLLVATMNSKIQKLEDQKQLYWKFARSRVWLSFFDITATAPPPFSIVSFTWWMMVLMVRLISYCWEKIRTKRELGSISRCKIDVATFEKRRAHADLLHQILKRFLKREKSVTSKRSA